MPISIGREKCKFINKKLKNLVQLALNDSKPRKNERTNQLGRTHSRPGLSKYIYVQ